MDRAGLVGDDGPTHHGAFDIAYLRCLPNIVLMAPRDEAMLVRHAAHRAAYDDGPIALRYPRGEGVGVPLPGEPHAMAIGTRRDPARGRARSRSLGYGSGVRKALEAADLLAEHGIDVDRRRRALRQAARRGADRSARRRARALVTVEEGVLAGGFGSAVWETLSDGGLPARGSSASGCPTATSRTASPRCCTPRSASPARRSPQRIEAAIGASSGALAGA